MSIRRAVAALSVGAGGAVAALVTVWVGAVTSEYRSGGAAPYRAAFADVSPDRAAVRMPELAALSPAKRSLLLHGTARPPSEGAALAASRFMGMGDKNAVDGAGTEAMR